MTNLSSRLVRAAAAVIVITLAGVGSAFAASGGDSNSAPVVCKKGYVYSAKKQICVQANSGLVDDKDLYEQGRALALAGDYENALTALQAVKNQDDSMVLTMIGYSHRKAGNWDEGMAFYRKALAINPENVNTREYLGEAYAEKGKLDLAKAELVKIEAVCGTDCEQYRDLSAAITKAH